MIMQIYQSNFHMMVLGASVSSHFRFLFLKIKKTLSKGSSYLVKYVHSCICFFFFLSMFWNHFSLYRFDALHLRYHMTIYLIMLSLILFLKLRLPYGIEDNYLANSFQEGIYKSISFSSIIFYKNLTKLRN
jgi:hypothetical protein